MTFQEINKALGNADLFLIDQLLKGRFAARPRVLDAGCGEGRNLVYFLKQHYDVYGIDANADAIAMARFVAPTLQPGYDKAQLAVGTIEEYHARHDWFHAVLCLATLHFAKSHQHFNQMVNALVQALQVGGLLLIGMESALAQAEPLPPSPEGITTLPAAQGGGQRYLLTQQHIDTLLGSHPLKLVEPVRTVTEHNVRTLTYLVFEKE